MGDIFEQIERERKNLIKGKDRFTLEYFRDKFQPTSFLRDRFNAKGEYDYCLDDLRCIIDEYCFAVASAGTFYNLLPSIKIPYEFGEANEKLFFYFMDDSYSRLYGIWNRMGNFLNIFFRVVKDNKIYFEKVIDSLNHNPHNQLQGFIWLNNFRSNSDYKKILKYRHPIIHKAISYSAYFKKFIEEIARPKNPGKLVEESELKIIIEEEREKSLMFVSNSFDQIDAGIDNLVSFIQKSFVRS